MVQGPPCRGQASLEVVIEEVGECVTPTGVGWGSEDPQSELFADLGNVMAVLRAPLGHQHLFFSLVSPSCLRSLEGTYRRFKNYVRHDFL